MSPSSALEEISDFVLELESSLKAKNVFKVESVGDSYICVTGLPQKQEDHAVLVSVPCRDVAGFTFDYFDTDPSFSSSF